MDPDDSEDCVGLGFRWLLGGCDGTLEGEKATRRSWGFDSTHLDPARNSLALAESPALGNLPAAAVADDNSGYPRSYLPRLEVYLVRR